MWGWPFLGAGFYLIALQGQAGPCAVVDLEIDDRHLDRHPVFDVLDQLSDFVDVQTVDRDLLFEAVKEAGHPVDRRIQDLVDLVPDLTLYGADLDDGLEFLDLFSPFLQQIFDREGMLKETDFQRDAFVEFPVEQIDLVIDGFEGMGDRLHRRHDVLDRPQSRLQVGLQNGIDVREHLRKLNDAPGRIRNGRFEEGVNACDRLEAVGGTGLGRDDLRCVAGLDIVF